MQILDPLILNYGEAVMGDLKFRVILLSLILQ